MTTPPGWYDDAHGAMRWWDGSRWTEHVAIPDPEPADYSEGYAVQHASPSAEQPTASYADQATAVTVPLSGSEYSTAETVPLAPAVRSDAGAGTRFEAPVAPPYAGGYAGADSAGAPGAGPAGYPGGYPASGTAPYPSYPTDGGAFIAATEPRKSRLWIVWVVLGVIVLGVVVALAVAIPILFLGLTTGAGSSEGISGGTTTEEPAEIDPPSGADEQAAAAAVELFNDSIESNDCGGYFASTTEAFRNALAVVDCDEFTEATETFSTDFQNYELTVTSVEQDGDSIAVYTTETYSSPYDDDGQKTPDPHEYEDHFRYIVVGSEDGWLIDESYSTDE